MCCEAGGTLLLQPACYYHCYSTTQYPVVLCVVAVVGCDDAMCVLLSAAWSAVAPFTSNPPLSSQLVLHCVKSKVT